MSDNHDSRDGAALGAVAGHEGGKGHTVRDAIAGAVGGHEVKDHEEKKAEKEAGSS